MENKKKLSSFIIVMSVLFFVGCTSSTVSPKEAGKLFIDFFVYEKKSDDFQKNFDKSKVLEKSMKKNADTFKESFITSFEKLGGSTSKKEAEAFSNSLIKQMKSKTSFTVEKTEEAKDGIIMTYNIYGLDFNSLLKSSLDDIVDNMVNDDAFAQTDEELIQDTLTVLNNHVKDASIVKKPIEVKIAFTYKKGEWNLADGQDDVMKDIYLSFLTGSKSRTDYYEQTNELLQNAMSQATVKLLE